MFFDDENEILEFARMCMMLNPIQHFNGNSLL